MSKAVLISIRPHGTCGDESLRLKRPPQSWCYVEEM